MNLEKLDGTNTVLDEPSISRNWHVTNTAWKQFQTVGAAKWKECSPADLRLTRGILSIFSEDDRRTRGS